MIFFGPKIGQKVKISKKSSKNHENHDSQKCRNFMIFDDFLELFDFWPIFGPKNFSTFFRKIFAETLADLTERHRTPLTSPRTPPNASTLKFDVTEGDLEVRRERRRA